MRGQARASHFSVLRMVIDHAGLFFYWDIFCFKLPFYVYVVLGGCVVHLDTVRNSLTFGGMIIVSGSGNYRRNWKGLGCLENFWALLSD